MVTQLNLNHQWRRFVAYALYRTFNQSDLTDQVKTWVGSLLNDLYTSNPTGSGDMPSYANIGYALDAGSNAGVNVKEAWTQYELNIVMSDDDSIVTLASNRFQIVAGTFEFHIVASLNNVGQCRVALYNVTQDYGVKAGANTQSTRPTVTGRDISNGTDWYEVQYHATNEQITYGLGRKANTGDDELYCDVNLLLYPDT